MLRDGGMCCESGGINTRLRSAGVFVGGQDSMKFHQSLTGLMRETVRVRRQGDSKIKVSIRLRDVSRALRATRRKQVES